jgi:dTDP-4-dehydrorhamnose 3,5-epimerase
VIFTPTKIPEVVLCQPRVYQDGRGFFLETYRAGVFAASGIDSAFVQENHSGSQQGVLRGLHYQIRQAQGKLVRVVAGEIYDVAVDLRRNSATFGNWVGVNLSAETRQQIWIPAGFAHGFYVLSPWAEIIYKTTDYYAPESERTLLWNDPTLKIDWPLREGLRPVISEKDMQGQLLAEAECYEAGV